MHLSIKNAAPTTIGTSTRQSTLNLLHHRAKSWIFCAVFTVDGMVATQTDLPGDLPSWARELLFQRRCAISGSLVAAWVGCLSDKVWLVALHFSNGTNTNFSHFQKQYYTFISNPTTPESNVTTVDSNFTKHVVKYHTQVTQVTYMSANCAGWVWQTIRLIQRSWHQHPQHRICSLICFRTITSYFYEHLPPWNR